ncbi:hypothetical protein C8R43DRAFT_875689 [Mycena crocata]|nr:hypothetical protein C8R43DRAFT_875689 [Mycena crocata]
MRSTRIPSCPPDAPQWFQYAYKAITKVNLGRDFNELIGRLITLERGYKYKTQTRGLAFKAVRLTKSNAWLGAGRGRRGSMVDGPALTADGAPAFREVFWKWWQKLQPDFRPTSVTARREAASTADWAPLRHPGTNGMFIVVLALYWWGRAVGGCKDEAEAGSPQRLWKEALLDVAWMMDGLIAVTAWEQAEQAETERETDELRSEPE